MDISAPCLRGWAESQNHFAVMSCQRHWNNTESEPRERGIGIAVNQVFLSWEPLPSGLRETTGLPLRRYAATRASMAWRSSLKCLARQNAKPDLHLVEPTGRGRSEMKGYIATCGQPFIVSLVDAVVVEHNMNPRSGRTSATTLSMNSMNSTWRFLIMVWV